VQGDDLLLNFRTPRNNFYAAMRRGAAAPRHPFDGTYDGSYTVRSVGSQHVSLQIVDGAADVSWPSYLGCPKPTRLNLTVSPEGKLKGVMETQVTSGCMDRAIDVSGTIERDTLQASYVFGTAIAPQGLRGDFELKRR